MNINHRKNFLYYQIRPRYKSNLSNNFLFRSHRILSCKGICSTNKQRYGFRVEQIRCNKNNKGQKKWIADIRVQLYNIF